MAGEKAVSGFIRSVYDAPLDGIGWQDVARGLMTTFGGKSSVIQTRDLLADRTDVLGAEHMSGPHLQEYEDYYHRLDVWVHAVAAAPGRAVDLDDLVPPQEFFRSEIYNDYTRTKLRVRYGIGAYFDIGKHQVAVIGAHREEGESPFKKADVDQLNRVLPHVRQSMILQLKFADLQSRYNLLSGILDNIDHVRRQRS